MLRSCSTILLDGSIQTRHLLQPTLLTDVRQEEIEQLQAKLGGTPAPKSPPPAHSSLCLSFETGFGSIEQRTLLDCIAMRSEEAASILLERGLVCELQVIELLHAAVSTLFKLTSKNCSTCHPRA
jgi:hypothetical protein